MTPYLAKWLMMGPLLLADSSPTVNGEESPVRE